MIRKVQTENGEIELVGRDDSLEKLQTSLTENLSVQLVGEPGTGKSTLLKWAKREANELGFRCVDSPPTDLVNAQAWWHSIDSAFGFSPGMSGSQEFRRLLGQKKPAYLFCDDLELVLERYQQDSLFALTFIQSLQDGMRVVCTAPKNVGYFCQDSVLASHFFAMRTIMLGALSASDTEKLVKQVFGAVFGQLQISATVSASGGVPGALDVAFKEWTKHGKNPAGIEESEFEVAYEQFPWVKTRVERKQGK